MKRITLAILALSLSGLAEARTDLWVGTIAPPHSAWGKGLMAAANEIRQRTDGEVNFKFRFNVDNDAETLRKMQSRIWQGGMFTPSALQDQYADITLYSLPMVFNSAEEANFVRSRMDAELIEGLKKKGLVAFGFAATGFAVLMSNEPVDSLDDVKGKEIWVPKGDEISFSAMRALGVNPLPDDLGNVLIGLQTNLYHMIAVSPQGANIMQWYTKVDYLTDMPLVYTFGFLALNEKVFEKLEPEHQAIVREVMARVHREFDESGIEDDAKAKQSLFNQGIERVVPDAEDFQEIRAVLARNNRRLAQEGKFSEKLYDEMLGYIDEYRREHNELPGEIAAAN